MTPSHVLVAAIVAPILAGCATSPRHDTTEADAVDRSARTPASAVRARAPVFTILSESEPAGAVAARDLWPTTSGRRAYAVVDDRGAPVGETVVFERRGRGNGGDLEVDAGEDITLYLRVAGDGSVAQTAAVAHDQNALTQFDPPLTVAYPELRPGETHEARAAMRVVDVRDTNKEREAGNAVRTIEYAGDARIQTPIGPLDAQRVEVTFRAKLRLARVERRETIWVVPGMGVVARDDREKLTIFAVPAKNERRRMVVAK